MKRAKLIAILLCGVSAALLFASLKMPVWQMRLEAPQYKDEEALKVKVYPSALKGDLNELTVLNSYIGVHIPIGRDRIRPNVNAPGVNLSLLEE